MMGIMGFFRKNVGAKQLHEMVTLLRTLQGMVNEKKLGNEWKSVVKQLERKYNVLLVSFSKVHKDSEAFQGAYTAFKDHVGGLLGELKDTKNLDDVTRHKLQQQMRTSASIVGALLNRLETPEGITTAQRAQRLARI